jgi:hypothetical protein
MSSSDDRIADHIGQLTIIDTHEHLPPFERQRDHETDLLKEFLFHYYNRDLLTAGMSAEIYRRAIDPSMPIADRWREIEPYWNAARFTGYGRCLSIALQDLYGIARLTAETIEPANAAFLRSLEPGHFRHVLKELSKIAVVLLDAACLQPDPEFYRSVERLDQFAWIQSGQTIASVEKFVGTRICSFRDWLEACEAYMEKAAAAGVVAFKNSLAYRRSLYFRRVKYGEAEGQFNDLVKSDYGIRKEDRAFNPGIDFQDYMVHFIMNKANKLGSIIQVHTGIFEGNGNIIGNGDPSLMSNLFYDYPDVTFDIFHIGYPFQQTLSAVAKMFPNVYIDMCWVHIISPVASVRALSEWLEVMPYRKISAFGGDFCFIDGVYGHQKIARQNIAEVLSEKVRRGLMGGDEACEVATALFYENPKRIFRLTDLEGESAG